MFPPKTSEFSVRRCPSALLEWAAQLASSKCTPTKLDPNERGASLRVRAGDFVEMDDFTSLIAPGSEYLGTND